MKAEKKGVKFGRKRSIDRDKFKQLYESGARAKDIACEMKIGRSTVYKLVQEMGLSLQLRKVLRMTW
ncbi:MAG: helix-turn-helix domain-containing protein [Chlamydiota bacterium]